MAVAIPDYVGKEFSHAPPGHRFRLYFGGWTGRLDGIETAEKLTALQSIIAIPKEVRGNLAALRDRQEALAERGDDVILTVDAILDAPFVTGMGMEHPTENGFAFLDPHGLPYLPGSSVKGVVRRAAEELALFADDRRGWTIGKVWWLFGFDAQSAYLRADGRREAPLPCEERRQWRDAYLRHVGSRDLEVEKAFFDTRVFDDVRKKLEARDIGDLLAKLPQNAICRHIHSRGAIELWDVYPRLKGDRLRVDIMNPHFGKYYMGKGPPGDDDEPKPILFLSLPARSSFTFHCRVSPGVRLPEDLRQEWKGLLGAAFDHAFASVGFGAKKGIGYGRFVRDPDAEQKRARRRQEDEERRRREAEEARQRAEEEERQRRMESLSPVERMICELEACNDARVHAIYAELPGLAGEEQQRLAKALRGAYVRLGKWHGKLSKKQAQKVASIKAKIGEG